MRLTFTKIFFLALAAAAAVSAPFLPASYAGDAELRAAPLNPAFLRYRAARAVSIAAAPPATSAGRVLGHRPSPVMPVAGPAPAQTGVSAVGAYQVSYDLRNLNKVTPVKDQGACGDCWAFAGMSSLESYFKPMEALDLSEADLDAASGFDFGSCNGGNDHMTAAYLARWSGPLVEGSSAVVKHAQNMIFLAPRASATDNDRIKGALQTYGALTGSFHYDEPYYNPVTSSFFADISTNAFSSNHEVTIVGWDDNYPRASFSALPPGDGAFLCKNSWGTGWGEAGFMWIKYGCSSVGYGATRCSF